MCTKAGSLILILLVIVTLLLGGCSGSSGGGAISPLTGVQTGSPSPDDAVNVYSHDNYFYLRASNFDNSDTAFEVTGHCITEGQPWHGVTTGTSGDTFHIDVNCGRKDSVEPAEWLWNSI